MYYYLCRYSYKYCSEIIYALERVDLIGILISTFCRLDVAVLLI